MVRYESCSHEKMAVDDKSKPAKIETQDGNAALRVIKNEKVGLVVTDWNMPNMSGLDLLREIRQDPQTSSLPVLMVTAEGLKENVMEAVKAGVSNYVVKPFTAEVLQEKIETIFKKMGNP